MQYSHHRARLNYRRASLAVRPLKGPLLDISSMAQESTAIDDPDNCHVILHFI